MRQLTVDCWLSRQLPLSSGISSVRMPKQTHLNIGGLVAVGFHKSGQYLLIVTHSGRGVFSTDSWSCIARDDGLAYPENGCVMGIGPIAGQFVPVTEKNYETDELNMTSPNGTFNLFYESGALTITSVNE